MAMHTTPPFIGIDVAKDELVICLWDQNELVAIPNTFTAIRRWLKTLSDLAHVAVEATGLYHVELIEQAHKAGHRVFVIDGYQLKHYRESLRERTKTDPSDARLLARYLAHEGDELRPWSPPPKAYRTLQSLLRRRARLIQARVAIQQSIGQEPSLRASLKRLVGQIDQIDQLIQKRLRQTIRKAGLCDQVQRLQAIEGVGPLTAMALVMAFLRGEFRNSDAFVAFLGLDVRVRDSGQQKRRRKLSKRGDPEIRRLLHNAAMAARRHPTWAAFYERYLDRGLKSTQALVILARKLARTAFALMKHATNYDPMQRQKACAAT